MPSKLLLQLIPEFKSKDVPHPPFPHLLRSNIPPTEIEASIVRDVIATAETEESRLTKMLSNHDNTTTLTNLKSKLRLDRTHRFIVEHKAILSTIRRVPPEILQSIFIYTLPNTPTLVEFGISELPWALSQVCQLWRFSMLSFSVMWRDFPVIQLDQPYTKKQSYLDFLSEMLKRSGNTPIRLVITDQGSENIAHPVLNMLVLQSDRWQEIKIRALLALLLLPTFQMIKGHLASLQSLFLNIHPEDFQVPIDLFWIAPQLRHLDIIGSTSHFIFPTGQLVDFCQTPASFNQIIRIISSSPSLRRLRFFQGFPHSESVLPVMTPLTLPDLIDLDVYIHPLLFLHDSLTLFNNLTIPAIEQLRYESVSENVIGPIRSMILRSGSPCLLKVLHLQVQIDAGELPSLLRLTPLLTDLVTTLPSDEDISAFIFDGNTPPLVPLLDQCVFSYRDGRNRVETIQAIRLFASSRCDLLDNATSTETALPSGGFHRLKIFRICFGSRPNRYRQYFEGWVQSDMSDELCKQRGRLVAIIPELRLGWHNTSFKRKFNLKWKKVVIGLLSHLETLKVEKVSDIGVSIQLLLKKFDLPSHGCWIYIRYLSYILLYTRSAQKRMLDPHFV